MNQSFQAFWGVSAVELLRQLESAPQGLTSDQARQRIVQYGSNILKPRKRSDTPYLLFAQFKSPIILILIFAAVLSFTLLDPVDALIILGIIFLSSFLGFWQERKAVNALEKLLAVVQVKATILRNGMPEEVPVEDVVPGDVTILSAGDSTPADCLILESKDLFMNEAELTGETYPVEKVVGVLPPTTPLNHRTNSLFMGTHVISGSAKAVVVHTGKGTEFGKVAERLRKRPPETEFERGVRRFGYLLMEVTMILVIAIFAINVYLARPVLESLLFSLALAVGLTPQLLPAIISINLAHGARLMARQKVIIKRLSSIENFGSMNVLCSDKTGTLTEGMVHVHSALDVDGNPCEKVLLYAYLNAFYQTGFKNPIDEAIRTHNLFDLSGYMKLDEVPYDFIRKRLSILVSKENRHFMVTKGALFNVLAVCSSVETSSEMTVDITPVQEQIQQHFEELSGKGFRILGIAYRDLGSESHITRDQEMGMTFLGFIVLFDPPKHGIANTINGLRQLGVSLKVITGDNRLVAGNVSQQIGLFNPQIIIGSEIKEMSDEALLKRVNEVEIFAEVEPNQKERVIRAFIKSGNVVGFMGDGINDASALHAADVGISVESAVDVAKDAADIVLLEKDLNVLLRGVREGRMTFANTLKYVFMATSANFGNMFSMAGGSLFLTFLPLLPKQILLTNLMTDMPEMTIASDSVDRENVDRPRRWDIGFIRKFMVTFGILSSVFDFLTFAALLFLLHATTAQFRAGWFMESVISASVIVLIIRTRRPFYKSKPSKQLLITTLLIVGATLIFPFTAFGVLFEFGLLPILFILVMSMIISFYIIATEIVKKTFYRKVRF